jgi:uncharacterized protein (TIGR00730 family)
VSFRPSHPILGNARPIVKGLPPPEGAILDGMSLRRVCVFCGSHAGTAPEYTAAARELGRALAERGIAVVFGAGGRGMMGALSDAAVAAGGDVIGVIPHALVDLEAGRTDLRDLRVVGSMHERKALMHELSDAFIALPGGLGTLEELTEVLTWNQLGLNGKPVVLLDVLGYWSRLLGLLDHAVSEGFVRPEDRAVIRHTSDVGEALALAEEPAPTRPRRLRIDET